MIQNRESLSTGEIHDLALDCIEEAIEAADPERATNAKTTVDGDILSIGDVDYDLTRYDEIRILGGGKAAAGIVTSLEATLAGQITDGLIVTKEEAEFNHVRCVSGDHPLPSRKNVEAAEKLLAQLESADRETLVIFVVTGGASSLLTAPAGDVTVEDIRKTTRLLLEAGASITEINTVRKHLSALKGGQVAQKAAPASVAALVISDVVGDDISSIGSGPTVPDETTFSEALVVFDHYGLQAPTSVVNHLESGKDGLIPETPPSTDPVFEGVTTHLIGGNTVALDAVQKIASNAGYETIRLSAGLEGEASEVAKVIAAIGNECSLSGNPTEPPLVLVGGGECTVTVSDDPGQGGPNQELVLSAALEIEEESVIAAVDTDGEDGSSTYAGAIADGNTVTDPPHARELLNDNDAESYLSSVNATIYTGPTQTNVNDVIVLIIPRSRSKK